jgi:hypothetical protein
MAQENEKTSQASIVNALTLIGEMIDCYGELAEQLDNCNNAEAAAMFHQLVRRQQYHLESLAALAPGSRTPPAAAAAPLESPADHLYAHTHYLMTPYHVVELALETETRIDELLETQRAGAPLHRQPLCQEYLAERDRHRQSLRQLLGNLSPPDQQWDEDPDPPHLDQ